MRNLIAERAALAALAGCEPVDRLSQRAVYGGERRLAAHARAILGKARGEEACLLVTCAKEPAGRAGLHPRFGQDVSAAPDQTSNRNAAPSRRTWPAVGDAK